MRTYEICPGGPSNFAFCPSPSLTRFSPVACMLAHRPAKLLSASVVPSAWTSVSPAPHLVGSFSFFHHSLIHPRHSPVTCSVFLFSGLLVQCPSPQQNGRSTGITYPALRTPLVYSPRHTQWVLSIHIWLTRHQRPTWFRKIKATTPPMSSIMRQIPRMYIN